MEDWLKEQKPLLSAALTTLLERIAAECRAVSPRSPDIGRVLLPYVLRGKMIRGSLVRLGLQLFRERPDQRESEAALVLGAAMELVQGLLLIHDDIMDQDDFRRGQEAVHYLYRREHPELDPPDARRLGENLGICLGDIAGFIAFECVAGLDLEPRTALDMSRLLSRELTMVALAQMDDVENGLSRRPVVMDAILRLYRFKTGRYTFSLPLMLGAMIAGADSDTLDQLGELGELFGVVFQIKDDEIGLVSDSQTIGKPAGSDIRGNKQTPYRDLLFTRADAAELARLETIFGNPLAGADDCAWVRERMEHHGVFAAAGSLMDSHGSQARELIGRIRGISTFGTMALESVLRYNRQRTW